MKTQATILGSTIAVAVAVLAVLPGCGPARSGPGVETPEEVTRAAAPETTQSGTDEATVAVADEPEPEINVDIDIGDVTYGVYANIEIAKGDVTPNMDVQRLSSPRFDQRTQYLTINISPPFPKTLPLVMVLGSTRFLQGHTVYMRVHTYREYTKSSGEEVNEEILNYDRILGEDRMVLSPDYVYFDAFEGMDEIPSTMLVYCRLEAWLFLHTDPYTFDPKTADLSKDDPKHFKLYDGFNPARINLVGAESSE